MMQRLSIQLKGHSQGMGLRPEVYRLAKRYKLTGWVKNVLSGVIIEVQGEEKQINQMIHSFSDWYSGKTEKFPLLELHEIPSLESSEFKILPSEPSRHSYEQDIPPDMRICPRCSEEVFSSENTRSEYIFNSCTECGPRYSIFNGFPLDRAHTSWNSFPPCGSCGEEYAYPENIRFHAQNISCPDCGPKLYFLSPHEFKYKELKNKEINNISKNNDALQKMSRHILNGGAAAVKSTSGIHLICSAENNDAVLLLRKIKGRYKKPFAVMYGSVSEIEKRVSSLTNLEKKMLLSKAAPIVILKGNDLAAGNSVSEGISFTGVFLPYNGIYLLLLRETGVPLVVTSANYSEDPVAGNIHELSEVIEKYSLPFLDHDLEILNPVDDSVVRFAEDIPLRLRNGRGSSPLYIQAKFYSSSKVFCAGADLKNTFALRHENRIVVSPHTGNISQGKSLSRYETVIRQFLEFYNFNIEKTVCDMHPDYCTSSFAEDLGVPVVRVQHHHAHCMALMAEHEFEPESSLFCAAFDGTGYGTDKNIWGGEFLLSTFSGFRRMSHLKYFKMPGGDSASREGYRTALFLLFEMYGERAEKFIPFHPEKISGNKYLGIENFYSLWKDDEAPYCSSAGRLFDAAASVLGILHRSEYEGHAGLLMESLYSHEKFDPYPFSDDKGIIDWSEMFEALLKEKKMERGASRFIDTLADMVVRSAEPHGMLGITGGVFQNAALVGRIKELAEKKKIKYYTHKMLPPNDGNISAGQAAFIIDEK